ncbi:MAG: alpha-ketoacid dehydrogenase subunit beta [Tepidanaerobacteraceae bacterium]|nr:alpha-ketoacid dehydrogenase subunit beta [Thermoanaerobacterales bacterium]
MRTIRYVEALNEALREEMIRDENILVMGEDIAENGGIFQVTKGLLDEFGKKRVRNTPISEAGFVGCAVGASVTGLRPVVEIMYTDFLTVCMDQIVNQAAKIRYMFGGKGKVPMVIRTQGGAGFGEGAQHSQSLEAWLAHIPGLKVVMPSTAYDAKGLLKAAIRDDNPVIFIETATCYAIPGEVPEGDYIVPLGKADIKREGEDITVVATGMEVHFALQAASELEKEGISLEVVDPRTISPLDVDTILKSVEKTGKLIISHVACKEFGIGAEIAAQVAENGFYSLDAPIKRLGATFTPVPYSKKLEKAHFPQVEDIVKAAKELMA